MLKFIYCLTGYEEFDRIWISRWFFLFCFSGFYRARFAILHPFDIELEDKESVTFKRLARDIEYGVNHLYTTVPGTQGATVIEFKYIFSFPKIFD